MCWRISVCVVFRLKPIIRTSELPMRTSILPLKNCIFQLKVTFSSLFPKENNVFTHTPFSVPTYKINFCNFFTWWGFCLLHACLAVGWVMLVWQRAAPPCFSLRPTQPPWQVLWPLCKPPCHLPVSSALFFVFNSGSWIKVSHSFGTGVNPQLPTVVTNLEEHS